MDQSTRVKQRNRIAKLLNAPVNNPEESSKSICVNIEDTSSGDATGINKVTASTNEHEETIDNETDKYVSKMGGTTSRMSDISIVIEEMPLNAVPPINKRPRPSLTGGLQFKPEMLKFGATVSNPTVEVQPAKGRRGAAAKRASKREEKN